MEEELNRPKWLLELENRKRKPRLAHEAGAGAPCMNCKSACSGLDLHFWRKICKICKCSRDDHDVDDDEFPQFVFLFGPNRKFKQKSLHMRINNNKGENEEDTMFDWIPPDTTKELAIDYMKALPTEKLPIKGTSGAALRRHLLQKQLPLHDINYKVCDKLTEQEQKQFEKYLESLKKYVGQGKVIKMFDIQPLDCFLMTPINATDMQDCNLQHISYAPSDNVQLRTPNSSAIKTSYANIKQLYEGQNKQDAADITYDNKLHNEEYNCPYIQSNASVNSNIARTESLEQKVCENSQPANIVNQKNINSKVVNTLTPAHLAEQEIVSMQTMQTSGKYTSRMGIPSKNTLKNTLQESEEISKDIKPYVTHSETSEASSIADSMLAEALLPPSAIHAKNIIGSTLDKKGLMFIREKLTNKYNVTDNPVTHVTPQLSRPLDQAKCNDILQYPCSVKAKEDNNFGNNNKEASNKSIIESNRNSLLKHNFAGSNIDPVSISQNSVNPLQAELKSSVVQPTVIHSKHLQNQVFAHVIDSNKQPITPAQDIEYLKDNIENLTINATKVQKCENCREDIRIGDVAIITEKANNAFWHPGCFVCSVCSELLVDLIYFYYKNKLYCGRDLAAFLEIPRCFACDELIFVREYTVAEGHNYHVKHFCCWDCDKPLAGQQYITENDRPLCLLCYQQSYAKICAACNIVIAADQQGVSIKNLNFHANEVCFCCYNCKKNLLNGRIAIKENKLFCSKECIAKFLH